jgi:hypothetical protein
MEAIKTQAVRGAQTKTTLADSDFSLWFGTSAGFYKITNVALRNYLQSYFAQIVNGKVPESLLPSYVDELVEGYYDSGSFYEDAGFTILITPNTSKIYLDLGNSPDTYRWGGTEYALIGGGLQLGILSTDAFRGDYGNLAYIFSQGNEITAVADLDTLYQGFFYVTGSVELDTSIDIIGGWSVADSDTAPTYVAQYCITDNGLYTRYYSTSWSAWDKTDKSSNITLLSLGAVSQVDFDALELRVDDTESDISTLQADVITNTASITGLSAIELIATTTDDTVTELLDINGDPLPIMLEPYAFDFQFLHTGDNEGFIIGRGGKTNAAELWHNERGNFSTDWGGNPSLMGEKTLFYEETTQKWYVRGDIGLTINHKLYIRNIIQPTIGS